MQTITLTDRECSLPFERHGEFVRMVEDGATYQELASFFALHERTAFNYRRRAIEYLKTKKGAGATDADPQTTHHADGHTQSDYTPPSAPTGRETQ